MNRKNELTYLVELKKIIRKMIKDDGKKDLKNQIHIIKTILFYISKIILIQIKNEALTIEEILALSKDKIDDDLGKIISDLDHIKAYDTCQFIKSLDDLTKIKIITILNKLDEENLKKFSLGELYDYFTTNNEKKLLGQVYTPRDIVKGMITSSLTPKDIIDNPYYRVIDPACGGGYFLLEAYDRIKKIIEENYHEIIRHKKDTQIELEKGIGRFISKNNIWGTDIDDFAVYMTRFSLYIRGGRTSNKILKLDSLLDQNTYLKDNYFDLSISNPPYIGHKTIDKDYRASLSDRYKRVYSDKGDISYCFFKKGHELLKENGKLSFITSRYFLESPSGKGLRSFIKEEFSINSIIDFYGENVFKGIGISPVIIEASKDKEKMRQEKSKIQVYKRNKTKKTRSFKENLKNNFIRFSTDQENLSDDGWILLSKQERSLFNKIDSQGGASLKSICVFKQGIITGCDQAFIIDDEELKKNSYEKDLIKAWIKNSDIERFYLKDIKRYIIYTDKIENIESYPHVIGRISLYKEKLKKRRECKNGIRKWYELQWGRDEELFKSEKIVFPYKADSNKFVLVREEVCSSADIYFINIKKDKDHKIQLEYLLAFLNSKVCEYYFKCIGKKLNDRLYEYYPNKLEILKIKLVEDMTYVVELVKMIESSYNEEDGKDTRYLKEKIDKYFYELYSLNADEIKIIESNY